MPIPEHNVSREANDGSRNAMHDNGYDEQRFPFARDQRADTKTTFYEQDIDDLDVSQRRKNALKRALYKQEGQDYLESTDSRQERKQQNRAEWKRRITLTYSGQLELTDSQKERAEHWMMDVLKINTFGHYSVEQVAVGVINVVAREDGRWIEDEPTFHDIMKDVGLTREDDGPDMARMKRLRALVRERIPSK